MSADSDTIAVYDARVKDYAMMTADLTEAPELEAFAKALPRGARVLDLGCGPGRHAGWLAARGFKVEAVDASSEMVALAANQAGVTARQAAFSDIGPPARFHGIWANFSLLHMPRAALPEQLSRLRAAGLDGHLLHLGMKCGTGEGPDRLGRFYAYWQPGELVALLEAAGYRTLWQREGVAKGLAGGTDPYVLIRARADG